MITWETNNCSRNIVGYRKKKRQTENEIWSINRIYITSKTFFLKNHGQNIVEKLFPDLFLKNQNQNQSLD